MACHPRALLCAVILLAASMALLPPPAAAGVRLGGITLSGGYARGLFYPPYYGPYPIAWAPYWNPGPWLYPGYSLAPESGKVLLQHAPADAEVYINGGYAGPAAKLKSLRLEPGVYDLELRTATGNSQWRIYVLSGNTLKIDTRRQP